MMMTSGSGVNYKSMFDAGSQIIAKEGTKSLFKGAGANILRGVAGAGVLSLYDKLQQVLFGKVYSGGTSCLYESFHVLLSIFFRIWLKRLNSRMLGMIPVESFITLIPHRLSFHSFGYVLARLYPSRQIFIEHL